MINRDYTKEVGLRTRKQTLSWPVTLLVLAVIGLGVWWFASTEAKTSPRSPRHQDAAALVDRAHRS